MVRDQRSPKSDTFNSQTFNRGEILRQSLAGETDKQIIHAIATLRTWPSRLLLMGSENATIRPGGLDFDRLLIVLPDAV